MLQRLCSAQKVFMRVFVLWCREESISVIKQLLDEVEHDIMNYQNPGLCYLPKAEADNTDTRMPCLMPPSVSRRPGS